MVDFINEVEEELRKDDYNRLLKKYGPAIGAILFLIVAGAAFLEWREYAQDKSAQKTAAVYTAADQALEDGDLDGSVDQFTALADSAPSGYAGLALMRAAAIRQQQGDAMGAISYFDRAASTFEAPRHRQLAQLKAAYLLADQGAYADVAARLDGLAVQDAPYEFLARELLGFVQSESGNLSQAREQFAFLTSIPGVPQNIKARAEQSMALMNASAALQAPVPVESPTDVDTIPNTTDNADASDDQ